MGYEHEKLVNIKTPSQKDGKFDMILKMETGMKSRVTLTAFIMG